MPRPHLRPSVFRFALALGLAALGPSVLHAALAGAAGTVFEAAPLLLAAELLPRRFGAIATAVGCGCGRDAPGALSLPATALCWIAFGPLPALGRLAVAGLIFVCEGNRTRDRARHGTYRRTNDVFVELLALAAGAALTVIATTALRGWAPQLEATLAGRLALILGGLVIGCIAPCATGAVAVAAGLATTLPTMAYAVLATGGIVSVCRLPLCLSGAALDPRRTGAVRIALALALALLVARGGHGFVNPKLQPFAALGAIVALLGIRRPTTSAYAWVVPGLLLCGLLAGSPIPSSDASATSLEDAYPGQRLTFVGRARGYAGTTVLERGLITCCRADAATLTVRTSAALGVPDGTWIEATGRLDGTPEGLVLRPARWQVVAPAADPFIYR